MMHDKKSDSLSQELFDGKAVTAFSGIERRKILIKFPDQERRIDGIWAFCDNESRHASPYAVLGAHSNLVSW